MRAARLVLLLALATAACAEQQDPVEIRPSEPPVIEPAFDPDLEPAAAVLALVPEDATVLEVTDFEQLRLQLGYGDLSAADPAVRRRFAEEAERRAPLLSPGLFADAPTLRVTQDDVLWEAHFRGPSGAGYVVGFRDDLAMDAVGEATRSGGPLAGADVLPGQQVATLGAASEPARSWAADPDLVDLVGPVAGATYLSRTCLPAAGVPADRLEQLDELGPFSVTFGGELVTVRLGSLRSDAFERARLPGGPSFERAFTRPVADPQGGRIGFALGDGALAGQLARERRLPFAACAP